MDKINFLHINAYDICGGAALAGYRFHKALQKNNYGSRFLCAAKKSDDPSVSRIIPGKRGYVLNGLIGMFFNYAGLQAFGYPSSFFLRNSAWVNNWADVIILRDLHWWYFSLGVLPYLASKAPLLWRFPDVWALTGHCCYPYGCERWKNGCGQCPDLKQYPKLLFDTTHFLWLRKQRIYRKLKNRLVFVSPSRWLQKMTQESPLTSDFRCERISTAVDLNIFKPIPQRQVRESLGIGQNEKVIMFSSVRFSDTRKGAKDIVSVVNTLQRKLNIPLLVLPLGHADYDFGFTPAIKVISQGFVGDEQRLAFCYSAADVYLSMSQADNLPNTHIEAAACGLPIVTLDSGGCRETLEHGRSGFVVTNAKEAVEALQRLLTDDGLCYDFSRNARRFAEENFSMQAQVEAYVRLAQEMIESTRLSRQTRHARPAGQKGYHGYQDHKL